tara:strand:- start:1002 stop:1223 length:222 start_codon:yes stop_codon:yes gene_type:complete
MILAFILTVYVDGELHNMGGTAAFRDVYQCELFGSAIEKSGNTTIAGNNSFYRDRVQTFCLPKFVSKDTKFWD